MPDQQIRQITKEITNSLNYGSNVIQGFKPSLSHSFWPLDTNKYTKQSNCTKTSWNAFQKTYHEDTVSRAKRTPPTGARKAAAIPAAEPQVTRSLRSLSFLKYLSHLHVMWYFRDPPCPSIDAMHAPVCTSGPAFPTCSDDDTAAMHPTICSKPASMY